MFADHNRGVVDSREITNKFQKIKNTTGFTLAKNVGSTTQDKKVNENLKPTILKNISDIKGPADRILRDITPIDVFGICAENKITIILTLFILMQTLVIVFK